MDWERNLTVPQSKAGQCSDFGPEPPREWHLSENFTYSRPERGARRERVSVTHLRAAMGLQ